MKEKKLEEMGYRLSGTGSVEICRWNKNVLTGRGACYKQTFYGVPTHRCMELTPSTLFCNNNCAYCWRPAEFMGLPKKVDWSQPEAMVEELIQKRKALLMGFKGNPKTNQKLFFESLKPIHFAISLSGEPTLYPYLSKLIDYLNRRENTFSTFLVTNGQNPLALKKLNTLPTQLYLSVTAPNPELYKRISIPLEKNPWERLLESCNFLASVKTRTVLRVTFIKNLNMVEPSGWVKLIKQANPHFIEFKGYSWIGRSRDRMKLDNVPTHDEVKIFADKIMAGLNYQLIDQHKRSRIVLYQNQDRKINRFINPVQQEKDIKQ
ncbi:MAG: 4-demethylwyosine synthase TYW1 [Candidatus Altiarchaeota archaeon]|nr:4-demethylwyosine synthase TYW1 [Candidatus Altiarchaeota archaeon]